MSASEDIRTRKGKRARNGHEPPAPIDARTRRGVMIGGTIALICAAGLSFPSLYGLARTGGLPMWLAPLLPVSLDVYAYIAMWFADRVPTTHPARASALRNGWLALALTVACNFFDHFLTFAASIISPLTRDILLSTVLALPPFIVGRVLHLRALADGNAAATGNTAIASEPADNLEFDNADLEDETGNDMETRQPPIEEETGNEDELPIGKPSGNGNLPPRQDEPGNPAGGKERDRQRPAVKQTAAGQPSTDTWVWIGKPVYEELRAELGKRPGETVFHGALSARVDELIASSSLVGEHGDEKPDVYADPSLSTAKRIRGEIETRFPGIMFGQHAPDAQNSMIEEVAA